MFNGFNTVLLRRPTLNKFQTILTKIIKDTGIDDTIGSGKVATPSTKGDKKREAHSPLYAQEDIQKKTRHWSGVSWNESPHAPIPSHTGDENSEVHYLTYPLNPADIPQIASELRALMVEDLRSAMVGAVKQATRFHLVLPRVVIV